MKATIFSGVKPSGALHVGSYAGAIKQWVEIQNNPSLLSSEISDAQLYFCVVDLHAVTVYQDPLELKKRTKEILAWYLACGIDPQKSTIFIQSHNSDHTYLAWLLDCMLSMGQLERMTQYKDKTQKGERRTVGLFNYPALMAADILLYGTTHVPVGDDQKQHIELARDIAEYANKTYGTSFTLPLPVIRQESGRIMSLQYPTRKMSKSENDLWGTLYLHDSQEEIARKIARAVTDSENEIRYAPEEKPGIANLLELAHVFDGENRSISAVVEEFKGKSYGELKQYVSGVIWAKLSQIQAKFNELLTNEQYLSEVYTQGVEKARAKSKETLQNVKEKMGFLL